ncbi:MAG TPA: aspartate aminotransferase family protein [Acidimicrobiales bacterium]
MTSVDRSRLAELRAREEAVFAAAHPKSRDLAEQARVNLLGGVPMNWMSRWPGAFPLFVTEAEGARFTDVDGHTYIDMCLGDTGAMTGHAPPATVAAISAQAAKGLTTMLPSEDAIWVGAELARRFGLPTWQVAMTATDANRFVLRLARHLTARPKVLVFNWCYHGTVDEALNTLDASGRVVPRAGNTGPAGDPALTTVVVEFNDIPALEVALAGGDVACVLAEPALTNIGIVLPDPGYHEALREITRRTGTLLVIDETHTICTGPGGYTAAHGLEPDLFVIGKPIAGGFPAAAYGMSAEIADRLAEFMASDEGDVSGIGGTLSGNPLAMAAIRATLSTCLLPADYDHAIPLATRWTEGVKAAYQAHGLEWTVQQLGCRAEYWFCPAPHNGGEAAAAVDHELDAFMHLYALNRGILLTPFHNMALFCSAHSDADVDRHSEVFGAAVSELVG